VSGTGPEVETMRWVFCFCLGIFGDELLGDEVAGKEEGERGREDDWWALRLWARILMNIFVILDIERGFDFEGVGEIC